MRLFVDSKVININILKDLKRKFDIVYEDSNDIKLKLKDNTLTFFNCEVDCSHWIEKIEEGNLNLSLSDLIDRMLIEFSEVLDIII